MTGSPRTWPSRRVNSPARICARPEVARASAERLREAVASARRVVRSRLEDLSVQVPLGGLRAAVEEVSASAAGSAAHRLL